MVSACHDIVLSIGGIAGRLRIVAPDLFLERFHERYAPFTIPSAIWVKTDFTVDIRSRTQALVVIRDLAGSPGSPVSLSGTNDVLEISRHDFDGQFSRDGDSWIGSASCEASEVAFEVLLRALWSAFLVRAGGALIHACAIRMGTEAVVFPGASGAGKSTLSEKWDPAEDVLTDELVPVRRSAEGDWRVYSSPFWGGLKRGGRSLASWPLARIGFLEKNPGLSVTPLRPAETVTRLLRLMRADESSPQMLRTALDLVASCSSKVSAVALQTAKETPAGTIRNLLALRKTEENSGWSAREEISEARAALRRGSVHAMKAIGTSMLPSVQPGDILFIQPSNLHSLSAGDIAVYWRPGAIPEEDRLIFHRLIFNPHRNEFTTKGDAIASIERLTDGRDVEILGKVVRIMRGTVVLRPPSAFASRILLARGMARIARARIRGTFYGNAEKTAAK